MYLLYAFFLLTHLTHQGEPWGPLLWPTQIRGCEWRKSTKHLARETWKPEGMSRQGSGAKCQVGERLGGGRPADEGGEGSLREGLTTVTKEEESQCPEGKAQASFF